MKDLLDCHGRSYTAYIDDAYVEGKLCVQNGEVYLCQNERDGDDCKDKQGYKYSWVVGSGSPEDLKEESVSCFHLVPCTDDDWEDWKEGDILIQSGLEWEIGMRQGKIFIPINSHGCALSNYTGQELIEEGWRLKMEKKEVSTCNNK